MPRPRATTMTSPGTAPDTDVRTAGTALPLASVPFTTVTAWSVTDPKLPPFVGDSWRPAAVSMLGAAAATAVTAMSLVGGGSAAPAWHSAAATAQTCVTTQAQGALGQLKYPACLGD